MPKTVPHINIVFETKIPSNFQVDENEFLKIEQKKGDVCASSWTRLEEVGRRCGDVSLG